MFATLLNGKIYRIYPTFEKAHMAAMRALGTGKTLWVAPIPSI